MTYGIIGLIILLLDVYAVIRIIGSTSSPGAKLLWGLGILVFPVIGVLVWMLAGPSGGRQTI